MEIKSNYNIISVSNSHDNKNENTIKHQTYYQPTFTGKASSEFLSKAGSFMKWIEDGGFMALFLIQDFLGMTVPRSIAGFLRDKEETGEYNVQEGLEVMGREGLTGPCMMAVAPLSLWAASRWGMSTSINTELIKHFGNSLGEMVSSENFDKSLLNDKNKFKKEFYRINTEKILENTLGKENVDKETVDYILEQLEHRENIPADAKLEKFRGKAKYRSQCLDNIVTKINEIKYQKSSELEMLRKVKLSEGNLYDAKNAFEGMEKYTEDAIMRNKDLANLTKTASDKIKHVALGKRAATVVGMIAATLGMLSFLPKIYARSNVAPGARKDNISKEQGPNNSENPTFKGKGNILENVGKQIDKNKNKFISSELQYNGNNFTNTLMAGLSIFGLLTPRGLRAYNRAQTDEKTGKKDLTELYEILIRDITSSLAVVFAVPMLTRALVTSYEKNSGFVLMQKDRTMTKSKTITDLFNPYSKAHVFTNSELSSLYDNINSKEKMLNFCKYIDKNGGDLQKILSKSENVQSVFNDNTLDLKKLASKPKAEKNKEIINFVENIEKKIGGDKSVNEIITKLMNGASKGGKSKITSVARGLNSVPGILTTLFISPYILGWVIPRFTYANTRRIHAQEDKERESQINRLKETA